MTHKKTNFGLAAIVAAVSALAAAQSSKAALVITATDGGSEAVNGSTFEIIDFTLTGLSGADTTVGPSGQAAGLLDLAGTFTATGTTGGMLSVPGNSTSGDPGYFGNFVTNTGEQSTPAGDDSSFVNFGSHGTSTRSGTGTATETTKGTKTTVSAIAGTSTSFGDTSWLNLNAQAINPGTSAASLVAQILVTPGSGVSFSGQYGTYGTNPGVAAFSFTPGGTSTPTPTMTPIISLTTAAPTAFGSQVGTLALTGRGSGSYNVATASFTTAVNTGYVAVTGFNPGTDQEVYGLRVLEGTGLPSAADLTTIIGDINAAGGTTDTDGATGTITASLVTAPFNNLFPGADILLTTTGTASTTPFLGFNVGGITGLAGGGALTVSSVAAVPEPASLAVLGLGVAGLLGTRRRAQRTA